MRPSVVLRACFLAASWTWCIGMWLPVLLIGDAGWVAWVAFAIPNVVGAASVGFVLTSDGARAFGERHVVACRWFSIVTILFHLSFLSWMCAWALAFVGVAWLGPVIATVALLLATLLGQMQARFWGALAAAVLVISLSCFAIAWATTDGRAIALPPGPPPGVRPVEALWMAPVLAFGFLTCPFLDLTILRTRVETPGRAGHRAFAIGFGVFFLAMIVGTLLYANSVLERWFSLALLGHFFAQSVFTMGAHIRELNERGFVLALRHPEDRFRRFASGAMFVALATLAISTALARLEGWDRSLYDLNLSPYALLFPAYVWIVAVPRTHSGRSLLLFGAAVLLASPLLWMGAIERVWPWLAPAVALPLAAPLAPVVFARLTGKKTALPTA